MRIVHVFHSYYPRLGGMETAVQGLAEHQAQLGHDVHVITSLSGFEYKSGNEIRNSVNIHRVRTLTLHYPDLTIPREVPSELLENVDVLHAHSQNGMFSMSFLQKASSMGLETACYFMAVNAFGNHPSAFIRLLAPHYQRRNTRKALGLVDLPLVKNGKDSELLKVQYGVEAACLPDGLPEYYLRAPQADSNEFRKRFAIRQDNFFLFIGRLHILKGPHILVRALAFLKKDVAVVLVGPDGGSQKDILDDARRLGLADRVYVLGTVDERTKIDAIDSCVAVVVPSLADSVESYSIVMSEAWARRKPVIASRVGAIPSRMREGTDGICVDASNPESLAKAMTLLAEEPSLAKSLGENGRRNCQSWSEIARKSVDLYCRIHS